ncbi:PQQ-binding-like beta-propeller repeat protein [Kitasatospora purpeofusca]|uniref:outer membrane protein assembly factor BamB family protein n=1 Tax=Kitasatospora purpeofusca TaxID=67352 RepID=UPI003F4AC502
MSTFEALETGDPEWVGRYRIVARLGAGGMGQVYLGRTPGGRLVALKVVRPELAEDREFRHRFAREVAAARRVNGVFTAGVVDADPEGRPAWLATAYVPGVDLGAAVARLGPWPEGSVLALGAALAEALEAIHGAGVVHRDLKPSNVLLAPDGPRVIDFGISAATGATALTRTGTVVGTPGFMSPEQLTGGQVTPACDVFSLGAVLAFTATGTGPFGTGSAHALSFRVVYEEPDLRGLPPRLRAVVVRCLVKEPGRRPTVAALLAEFSGAGAPAATVAATGSGWIPGPVADLVREHTVVQPPSAPPPVPHLPIGGEHPPAGTFGPPVGPLLPGASAGPGYRNEPVAGAAGVSRRRLLLGLGGTGIAAGGSYVGWRLTHPAADPGSSGHSGRPLWSVALSLAGSSTPTVDAGTVYGTGTEVSQGEGGIVYAVDAATGRRLWTATSVGRYLSPPTVADTTVFVSTDEGAPGGAVHAVDAATGERRWRHALDRASMARPAVADGQVFAASASSTSTDPNPPLLFALDARSGEKVWQFPLDGSVGAAPLVHDGAVIVRSELGTLYAVDAKSGKQRWKFATGNARTPLVASPGGIHTLCSDGLYFVDSSTGRPQRKVGLDNDSNQSRSIAVADGVLYLSTFNPSGFGSVVVALDVESRERLWRVQTPHEIQPSLTKAGTTVYFSSGTDNTDTTLHAVDASHGGQQWTTGLTGTSRSAPTVADERVHLLSGNNAAGSTLYAVST